MGQTLLAIDAGNSRLKFGLFVPSYSSFYERVGSNIQQLAEGHFPSCRRFLAIPAADAIPWKTLASWNPNETVIAGSNPHAIARIRSEWPTEQIPMPIVVQDRALLDLQVDVEFPDKVGIDRLLSAVAANALRPRNRAAIVIDSGTATTVNLITNQGVFSGGAILPGLEMSAKALNHYTAALPLIPVQELGGLLPVSPGRNTREAIRNGLFWGQVGSIRELVRQFCIHGQMSAPKDARDSSGNDETVQDDSPWMMLTGGGGPVLSSQFPGVLLLPSLGMHGLAITVWNRSKR